jgi:hypothetical protein
MRCPNRKCRKQTGRTITAYRGTKMVTGCPSCFEARMSPNVRTNKKIWTGKDAYGEAKTKQMNRDWIEGSAERAAKMRKTAHHSGFST